MCFRVRLWVKFGDGLELVRIEVRVMIGLRVGVKKRFSFIGLCILK